MTHSLRMHTDVDDDDDGDGNPGDHNNRNSIRDAFRKLTNSPRPKIFDFLVMQNAVPLQTVQGHRLLHFFPSFVWHFYFVLNLSCIVVEIIYIYKGFDYVLCFMFYRDGLRTFESYIQILIIFGFKKLGVYFFYSYFTGFLRSCDSHN